ASPAALKGGRMRGVMRGWRRMRLRGGTKPLSEKESEGTPFNSQTTKFLRAQGGGPVRPPADSPQSRAPPPSHDPARPPAPRASANACPPRHPQPTISTDSNPEEKGALDVVFRVPARAGPGRAAVRTVHRVGRGAGHGAAGQRGKALRSVLRHLSRS